MYFFLMSVGHFCQDGDKFIRLWIHEVCRVFYDRLIDKEDKETFFGIVKERTSNFFKQSLEKVQIISSELDRQTFSSIIFVLPQKL